MAGATALLMKPIPSGGAWRQNWRLVSFGRSLRPHEQSSESAEVQSLLKLPASLVRENHRAGRALCGARAVARSRQKGVNVEGFRQAKAYDLSNIIDP